LAALALLAVGLLAFGAWQAIGWWQGGRAVAALQPQVKLVSVYVTRVLEYQFGEASNITVGEFIQVTENGLAEIEKATMAVKAARSTDAQTVDKTVAYMGESQELLRALNRLARMQVKVDTLREQMDRLEARADSANTPAEQRAVREQLGTVLKSVLSVLGEAQAQAEGTSKHLDKLIVQQPWVQDTYGKESAVPLALLQKSSDAVSKSLGGSKDRKQGLGPAEQHDKLPVGRVQHAASPVAVIL
jgi:hypothetical protein